MLEKMLVGKAVKRQVGGWAGGWRVVIINIENVWCLIKRLAGPAGLVSEEGASKILNRNAGFLSASTGGTRATIDSALGTTCSTLTWPNYDEQ